MHFLGFILNIFNNGDNVIEDILRELLLPLSFRLHAYAHSYYIAYLNNILWHS